MDLFKLRHKRGRRLVGYFEPLSDLGDGKAILARTPFGCFGEKAELHGAVIFLIGDAASGFVTGVTIPVDGGYLTDNI
jgi:NAD(P)-dependent dehydrogenase (short-subunit alcohol dehydrogenase family)